MDGWSFTQQMIVHKVAQKIFKSKFKPCPVNAGHYMVFKPSYMAFKQSILFVTYLTINFGCNSESGLTLFPSFGAI